MSIGRLITPSGSYEVTFEYGSASAAVKDNPEASSTSASAPTPQSIINDIHRVAGQPGTDLSGVKKTVECVEKRRYERIVNALKGQTDLEIVKGTKGRRFVVAYWAGDEVKTAQGVEYPVKRNEDGEAIGISVLIDDWQHPFISRHTKMEELRKFFENDEVPYHIAYFDN